jgi:hypothetical protein
MNSSPVGTGEDVRRTGEGHGAKQIHGRLVAPKSDEDRRPDEGKFATALARKAGCITTHDDRLIKNANGHIETGPRPDLPSQPELLLVV